MTPSRSLSLAVLAEDLAEDSAAYIGAFCERASNLKWQLLALKVASITMLLVGGRYLAQSSHWLPGSEPPLWLLGVTWGLIASWTLVVGRRWPARVEAYEQAAHRYTKLYLTFTRLARGDYRGKGQQARFMEALAEFHQQRQPLACRPIAYQELVRARANFRQQTGE